jgi:SAM-dependent methyltransferase
MIALYGATLFVGAFLLFSIQPLVSRMLTPLVGGAPAVWNTCVVFFQTALVAGYAWSHLTTVRMRPRWQGVAHLLVLGAGAWVLPVAVPPAAPAWVDRAPALALLFLLAGLVGLPFVAAAATAPTLQAWFSRSPHARAHDPFFLYAASNAGSLAALAAYPVAIEPAFTLGEQARLWTAGYVLLVGLTALGLWRVWREPAMAGAAPAAGGPPAGGRVTAGARLGWLALAAVPASLLLGTTTYITTDIAAVPLLWVVPLAVYLSTFILAFGRGGARWGRVAGRLAPLAALAAVASILAEATAPVAPLVALHLAALFVLALGCHAELARLRPEAAGLTRFYLWVALGGAVGGLLATLAAPLIFVEPFEYPLGLCLAVALAGAGQRAASVHQRDSGGRRGSALDLAVPAAIGLLALLSVGLASPGGAATPAAGRMLAFGPPLLACAAIWPWSGRFALALALVYGIGATRAPRDWTIVTSDRTFFGVHRVAEDAGARLRFLVHGRTIHGVQSTDPARRGEPLSYFHRGGPLGDIARHPAFERPAARVAVLGLGTGAMAAYGRAGQAWTFFEIDTAVIALARDRGYFTYLRDTSAEIRIVPGDARLSLAREPGASFDAVALDVFSSDAIPVHLLTREALALYLRVLAPGGLVAFHLSNRHLDLVPVVAALARDAGLAGRVRADEQASDEDWAAGRFPSTWVVLARQAHDLGPLEREPRWHRLPSSGARAWTDDYSNLVRAFRWR